MKTTLFNNLHFVRTSIKYFKMSEPAEGLPSDTQLQNEQFEVETTRCTSE